MMHAIRFTLLAAVIWIAYSSVTNVMNHTFPLMAPGFTIGFVAMRFWNHKKHGDGIVVTLACLVAFCAAMFSFLVGNVESVRYGAVHVSDSIVATFFVGYALYIVMATIRIYLIENKTS